MIALENDELRNIVREEIERGFDRERARKQIQNQVESLIFEHRNEHGYVGKLEYYTRLLQTAQKYDLEPESFNLRVCAEDVADTLKATLQELEEASDEQKELIVDELVGHQEVRSVREARSMAEMAIQQFKDTSEGDS